MTWVSQLNGQRVDIWSTLNHSETFPRNLSLGQKKSSVFKNVPIPKAHQASSYQRSCFTMWSKKPKRRDDIRKVSSSKPRSHSVLGACLHLCPWDPTDLFPNISSAQNLLCEKKKKKNLLCVYPFASENSTQLFVADWLDDCNFFFPGTQLNYFQLSCTQWLVPAKRMWLRWYVTSGLRCLE